VDGGICSLLKAYPEAARIRSPVSVKLPLEITLGRGSYRDWNDGVEALLKAYPEAAGLKNPYTGKYPLQLAIERETHFDDGVYGLIEVSPEVALVTSFAVVSGGETQARKTSNNDNSNSNSNSNTTVHEMMPLFALAALENCSASGIMSPFFRENNNDDESSSQQ
jgi:hypothetical protein